jgi:serine/threonine protein kinase
MSESVVNRCELSQGDVIDNTYRVERILGEGAFGKVFLVIGNNREKYALKILKLWEVPYDVRKPMMDRFDMEFQTGQIDNEYLVHSINYGTIEGNPYIVMEYCENGDLESYIKRNRYKLPSTAIEVLFGLNALHKNGKVHRDLKPENVLVRSNNKVALTDFGVSGDRNKRLTARNILGRPKEMFGTFAYMPPEQVGRERGDATVLPTTDIFSFGVMYYQLITGELPFGQLNDENELAIYIGNAKKGQWNKDSLLRQQEGKRWLNVIEGCLKSNFKERLQTTEDVLKLIPNNSDYFKDVKSNNIEQLPSSITKPSMILLRIMQGENYGHIYKLVDYLKSGDIGILTIGRETDNTIIIREFQSAYVSRHHATIETDGCRCILRDGQWRWVEKKWQESLNGTFVNSTQVDERGVLLHIGDIISLGDVKIRVEQIGQFPSKNKQYKKQTWI